MWPKVFHARSGDESTRQHIFHPSKCHKHEIIETTYQVIIPLREEWNINLQTRCKWMSLFSRANSREIDFSTTSFLLVCFIHYGESRNASFIEFSSLLLKTFVISDDASTSCNFCLVFNKQLHRRGRRTFHLLKLILRCDMSLLRYKLFLFNNSMVRFSDEIFLHNNENFSIGVKPLFELQNNCFVQISFWIQRQKTDTIQWYFNRLRLYALKWMICIISQSSIELQRK